MVREQYTPGIVHKVKAMLLNDDKLTFLDFSKPFQLYMNASDVQLGATLVQSGRPLGFYMHKLNSS